MTNLLRANDISGQYPDSWYAATAQPLAPCPPLTGRTTADVCVIGAGYTGLSTALHLAKAGRRVVVLEAQRIGFGASGRNGGQLGSGQRQDQITLEALVGQDDARKLWDLGEAAKQLVVDLCETHQIDCDLRPGIAWAASTAAERAEVHDYVAHMDRAYDYTKMTALDAAAFQALCPSTAYVGGIMDHGAWHLHPLKLCFGLARAALDSGAVIHEASEVHSLSQSATGVTVQTASGAVTADQVVLAGNGYLAGLDRQYAARVMPINNFIVATEPLGARTQEVLSEDVAVADMRFVVNYFRLSADKRLLFGGGESYGYRFPRDIRKVVLRPLLKIFPYLSDISMEYAWGGTLAVTMKRMPFLSRVSPRILAAGGYSGHGVGNAVQAGGLMAQAIKGQSEGFDTFARIPATPFPGGPAFRSPLLALGMTWYALRDRLGI